MPSVNCLFTKQCANTNSQAGKSHKIQDFVVIHIAEKNTNAFFPLSSDFFVV